MGLKVAVASWDGEHITQHFGHAEQFLIYELDGDSYKCLETRENQKACNGRDHNVDLLAQSADLLADCAFVLVSRIGPGARAFLAGRGIIAMEAPIFIDQALERLIKSRYLNSITNREIHHGKEDYTDRDLWKRRHWQIYHHIQHQCRAFYFWIPIDRLTLTTLSPHAIKR